MKTCPLRRKAVLAIFLLFPPTGLAAVQDTQEKPMRELFERGANAVAQIRYKVMIGALAQRQEIDGRSLGVLLDAQGLVVTPSNLYEGLGLGRLRGGVDEPEFVSLNIVLRDGRTLPASPLGWDRDTSLAFLRIQDATRHTLPYLRPGNRAPRVAEQVMAVGLLPAAYEPGHIFTLSRVNAVLHRPARVALPTDDLDDYAGGPVLAMDGELLGLVGRERALDAAFSLSFRDSLDMTSIIPSSNGVIVPVARFAELLKDPPDQTRQRTRGFLGIMMQAVSEDLAKALGLPQPSGVLVTAVIDGSPAQDHGIEVGDVLLRLDGETIEYTREEHLQAFTRWVQGFPPGKEIQLDLWREGEVLGMPLALAQAPRMREDAETREAPALGITVRELTPDVLMALQLPRDTGGVAVDTLESAGPAQMGKVQRGDIIQRVDGVLCDDLEGFMALITQARQAGSEELLLFVRRAGETLFLSVKPDWDSER